MSFSSTPMTPDTCWWSASGPAASIPHTLILLSNLGSPRRPAGVAVADSEPALPDPETAARQLPPLTSGPVTEDELPALRLLHRAAASASAALLAGTPVDTEPVNALASGSRAQITLAAGDDGRLWQVLAWDDPSVAAGLARRLAAELAALDPLRLRRCARPECDLVFYDTTRSRPQRWHAEDPCGWRERQRRRRSS
jgi:CGNR zinc finger